MLWRSVLFVPGHRADMLAKAPGRGADMLILDLEDGVPPSQKDAARRTVREWTRAVSGEGLPGLLVRLNALSDGAEAELRQVLGPRVAGVCLPKVESPQEIVRLAALLDGCEPECGVTPGATLIVAFIESARGLLGAQAIGGASPRVAALAFGSEDFALDIGARRTKEGAEISFARSQFLIGARAAGVVALDGIVADITDDEFLRRDTLFSRQLGFDGRQLIHPRQVPIVNEAYAPSAEELAYARKVCDAFDAGLQAGAGAILVDGKMVDRPVALRARRIVEFAEGSGRHE